MSEYKYLGIWFTIDLLWTVHINKMGQGHIDHGWPGWGVVQRPHLGSGEGPDLALHDPESTTRPQMKH